MPADTSLRGMITFQDWTSIDITFLLSAEAAKKLIDLVELCPEHFMVVIAPGVPCNPSCSVAV